MDNSSSSPNKVSWQKRVQYNFDNFMSKGSLSVFLALLSLFFGAFVAMTIARYIVELLFPNQNLEDSSELYIDAKTLTVLLELRRC